MGWYDLYEDWHLIESSFAQQYGIRLRSEEEMSWDEFSTLLSGILPETPLGQIVEIRSETDKDVLKTFTPRQRQIRNEWRTKMASEMTKDPQAAEKQIAQFQKMMKEAFSQK